MNKKKKNYQFKVFPFQILACSERLLNGNKNELINCTNRCNKKIIDEQNNETE